MYYDKQTGTSGPQILNYVYNIIHTLQHKVHTDSP